MRGTQIYPYQAPSASFYFQVYATNNGHYITQYTGTPFNSSPASVNLIEISMVMFASIHDCALERRLEGRMRPSLP